jgi:hypothetical protein
MTTGNAIGIFAGAVIPVTQCALFDRAGIPRTVPLIDWAGRAPCRRPSLRRGR